MSQTHIETKTDAVAKPPGFPRWVKASGIILLVLILVFAILHFSGAHGPASHMPAMEQMDHTTPEGGHLP